MQTVFSCFQSSGRPWMTWVECFSATAGGGLCKTPVFCFLAAQRLLEKTNRAWESDSKSMEAPKTIGQESEPFGRPASSVNLSYPGKDLVPWEHLGLDQIATNRSVIFCLFVYYMVSGRLHNESNVSQQWLSCRAHLFTHTHLHVCFSWRPWGRRWIAVISADTWVQLE